MARSNEKYIVYLLLGVVVLSLYFMLTRSEGFQNETVPVGPPTVIPPVNDVQMDNSASQPVTTASTQDMLSSITNSSSATPATAMNLNSQNSSNTMPSVADVRAKVTEVTMKVNELSSIVAKMK